MKVFLTEFYPTINNLTLYVSVYDFSAEETLPIHFVAKKINFIKI